MSTLLLYGTPLSHFTRKVRIVLHELGVPFELRRVPSLLESADAAVYGANPLMRIPTLVDGDRWIIESDHIAREVVRTRAPQDPLRVLSERIEDLNRLAVINGIMAHEVTIILAARGGMKDVMAETYFAKLGRTIINGLEWLERETAPEADGFDYLDVSLICMWQHLVHFRAVPGIDGFERIPARVRALSLRPSVATTAPAEAPPKA